MATPEVTYFKPRSVPLGQLDEVCLSVEGFEALRLADHEGLSHEAAAEAMGVSRQTFGRVLSEARQCVAKVLAGGLALKIEGGNYSVATSGQNRSRQGRQRQQPSGHPMTSPKNDTQKPSDHKEDWTMAKIAISSEGPSLDAALDPRFGRAAGFMVVDPQTLEFTYLDNGASQARAQGAGIQAAEMVANSGAAVVLTGYVGPKAFRALQAAGIRIGQNLENMTVRKAIELLGNNTVDWAQQPNRRRGRHGR